MKTNKVNKAIERFVKSSQKICDKEDSGIDSISITFFSDSDKEETVTVAEKTLIPKNKTNNETHN